MPPNRKKEREKESKQERKKEGKKEGKKERKKARKKESKKEGKKEGKNEGRKEGRKERREERRKERRKEKLLNMLEETSKIQISNRTLFSMIKRGCIHLDNNNDCTEVAMKQLIKQNKEISLIVIIRMIIIFNLVLFF